MKKSLVALAVMGAFAGAASAQSSVTIYGLVDMSLAKTNNTGAGFAVNPGAPANNAYTLQQSSTSRLGFRGTEDMGGGLSAQFQIEHRFNPDTGAVNSATSFWNGRSFVQLTQAGVGSVYLGRDYNPAFWVQLKSDPFGNDGVGQAGVTATYAGFFPPDSPVNGATVLTSVSARTSNTIGFKSASFGGLTAQAAVSLSEATQQGRHIGFNVEYAAGPLYLGGAYETVSDGTADGSRLMNFAVHYNLGFVKPMFYYAKSKHGARGNFSSDMWMLSATAPLAGGTLKAQYYSVDFDRRIVGDRTKLGLGYNYPLSKRTNLYADMGLARQKGGAKNNNAYAFGVRHLF
jgi:predicted porin